MRKQFIKNNPLSVFNDYMKKFSFTTVGVEKISAEDSCGRVLAHSVYAKLSDPYYNASAMDGIAVRVIDTIDAKERQPKILKEGKDFCYVNTGNPLPQDYDAVIMIEDVADLGDGEVEIIAPAHTWQNVRIKGECIVEGEMVLPKNSIIDSIAVGALIASGNNYVEVYKRPRLGIIPTGDEMINDPKDIKVGRLIESNSKVFSAKAKLLGVDSIVYPIVKDREELLEKALQIAVEECDIVIINAGSSAGTKDYTVDVIEKLGRVFAHGFAIKPGKPTILATVSNKPVIGVPGYPVSSYLVFDLFVTPILCALCGKTPPLDEFVEAKLATRVVGSYKATEYIRVALGKVDNQLIAQPLARGAANVTSMLKADGLLIANRLERGIEEGETVNIKINKPIKSIEDKLVLIGSHDLICDLLREYVPLVSMHVGSTGGIEALKSNVCHIAPIHLLDVKTGIYNIEALKANFKGQQMALIKGVGRTQGLLVEKNNPYNIKGIEDLTRFSFANRQRGAGTRILLDYKLKELGIDSSLIKGYDKEFSTHTAVASAVESKTADTGLAVYSVAKVLGLDFIPIADEHYDFVTPANRLKDAKVINFINALKSESFLLAVEKLGGYTTDGIGEITIVDC